MFVYVHSCFAERCILATACMVGTPTATAVGGAMVSPILDELCSRAAAAAEPFVPLQRACPRECRCGRPFGFVCVSRSVWLVVCVRVLVCVHVCKQA